MKIMGVRRFTVFGNTQNWLFVGLLNEIKFEKPVSEHFQAQRTEVKEPFFPQERKW